MGFYCFVFEHSLRRTSWDTTHDWVVIYYERDNREGQATVVTKLNNPMKGKRVVRGREVECQRYYEQLN
jgi:DNA polymerase (family X)